MLLMIPETPSLSPASLPLNQITKVGDKYVRFSEEDDLRNSSNGWDKKKNGSNLNHKTLTCQTKFKGKNS